MLSCKNNKMKESLSMLLGFALLLSFFAPYVSAASPDAVIPEGTRLNLQLNKNLSTRANSEGDSFTAVVTTPVYSGDRIIIPKGGVVNGSIARILRPGKFQKNAVMNLSFQSIDVPGRGQVPIVATLINVDPRATGSVGPEGTMGGDRSVSGNIARVLVPGLLGAGIGTLAGRSRGTAAIGAGIGATIGLGGILLTSGQDIECRRGAMLVIELNRPLTIPAEEDDTAIRNH
jgi:hypothetical protein